MSKNLTIQINGTQDTPAPAGKTFGGFVFKLVAPGGGSAESEVTLNTSWMFANAAPGNYTVAVRAVDSDGALLGGEISATVTVPEDPVVAMFPQPTGLIVSLS